LHRRAKTVGQGAEYDQSGVRLSPWPSLIRPSSLTSTKPTPINERTGDEYAHQGRSRGVEKTLYFTKIREMPETRAAS
jgi:hypothetical protein